jgi:hypothetical protein
VNITRLFGPERAVSMQMSIANALQSSADRLVPTRYSEVVEGYKVVYDVIANTILKSDVAVAELVLSTNSPKTVSVQLAFQHPLRRVSLISHLRVR